MQITRNVEGAKGDRRSFRVGGKADSRERDDAGLCALCVILWFLFCQLIALIKQICTRFACACRPDGNMRAKRCIKNCVICFIVLIILFVVIYVET